MQLVWASAKLFLETRHIVDPDSISQVGYSCSALVRSTLPLLLGCKKRRHTRC